MRGETGPKRHKGTSLRNPVDREWTKIDVTRTRHRVAKPMSVDMWKARPACQGVSVPTPSATTFSMKILLHSTSLGEPAELPTAWYINGCCAASTGFLYRLVFFRYLIRKGRKSGLYLLGHMVSVVSTSWFRRSTGTPAPACTAIP